MKFQLLLFFLALCFCVSAQKTGFTNFSSHSGVHKNNNGQSFIYAIGEPINNFSENAEAQIRQGLLHSDIAALESDRAVIQIRVFIDVNKNGVKDTNEQYITQGKIRVIGGLIHVFTDKEGINYFADPGDYSFEYIIENKIMGYTTSQTQDVSIVGGDVYKKVDFGIAPEEVIDSAEIYFSLDRFRCNRPARNVMCIMNTGGAKLQKPVFMEIDDRIDSIYFETQPDLIINPHLVAWNLCLEPGQRTNLHFTVTAPGVTSPSDIGQAYKLKAWIDLQNNLTEERVLRRRSWILRCSYDPNDKLVVPDRTDSLALLDKELVYTIRFQNTGNDIADDVVVTDTLDSNLDMSTFSIINSSHPNALEVITDPEKEHIVNFQFKNIFLPDSTTNEPGSNGHVTYKIKAKANTPLNTEIQNTAHIYFDFNPAIVTNTTSSTLVDTFPIPKEDVLTEITQVICAGDSYEGYTDTGVYEDSFSLSTGYDSIRILKLYTLEQEVITTRKEICQGESYQGHEQSGIYRDTITNGGCSQITELNLQVSDRYESYELIELCSDESYAGYKDGGIVVQRYQTVNGCDSIHTIELVKNTTRQSHRVCNGETYEGYEESGIYEDIFVGSNGCDSLRILDLTVIDRITTELEIEICQDEEYKGYDETGIYTDFFVTQQGCDSVRTIILNVLESPNENVNIEICEGESYEGHETTGVYENISTASNGCDSIRTIELIVHDNIMESVSLEICTGESYEGYTETGLYEDVYQSINGCDSLRILDLSVINIVSETLEQEICEGESYEGYTTSGQYTDTFVGNNGCDSTRILTLEVLDNITEPQQIEICQGDTYEGYTTSGDYEDTFPGSNGCDSTRALTLIVLENSAELIEVEICQGESYEGYVETGTYEDGLTNNAGCDSLRTIKLDVLQHSENIEEVYLCLGETYEGYEEEGLYTQTYTNAVGCDSVRQIEIKRIFRDDPICAYEYDYKPKYFGETQFLDLYPNPTKNTIELFVEKPERLPAQLEILSVHRKRILLEDITTARTTVDLSPYSNGVYIFILRNGNNIYIQRVIKT